VASDIDTVVTVPDGSTIILGGMLKLNQSKGGSKVPLLGDIPIVGGLFRTIGNEDRQNKLYVFVKGEILRPSETLAGLPDLNRISLRDRESFEKFEREFQEYEDWPGIKPKPMDPLKVLDAR
jgi:type II secretory pathway component GspD/PulD (secretin)